MTRTSADRSLVQAAIAEAGLVPGSPPPPGFRIDVLNVLKSFSTSGVLAERWARGLQAGLPLARTMIEEITLVNTGLALAFSIHGEVVAGLAHTSLQAGKVERTSPLARFAAEMASGSVVGCVAATEDHTGSNLSNAHTTASRAGAGWRISGVKRYTTSGDIATHAAILAIADGAPTLFFVDLTEGGVTRSAPFETIGMLPSNVVRLSFDLQVSDACRVGPVGAGLLVLNKHLRRERLLGAMAACRMAAFGLELAINVLRERHGAQGPLLDLQAIGHRLAAAHCSLLAARALAESTFHRECAETLPDHEIAGVKLHAARTAFEVLDEAMQMLGGRGYTTHYPIAELWHAARLGRIGGGTDEVMLEVVASHLRRSVHDRVGLLPRLAQQEEKWLYSLRGTR